MSKQILFAAFWLGLTMLSAPAIAGDPPTGSQGSERLRFVPVASKAEFSRYLYEHPEFPLHKLRREAVENFVDSLVFTPRGIGSYSYLGLSPRLSVGEIRNVLRVIGAEDTLTSIPTLAHAQSGEDRGEVAIAMSNVCDSANSPWCETGGGKTKTDSVCATDWDGKSECEFAVGDICPSSCRK
ncbi:hypothetical protein ACI2IY_03465 [Lysobacter enzymogenes]|uniref:hypothetical protein n=1 Tax=Lysobacter enzymogenes TaxID=69 RepID=UPI0038504956